MSRTIPALSLLALLGVGAARGQNLFFGSVGHPPGSQDALYTSDLNGAGLANLLAGPSVVSGVAADGGAGMVFWHDPLTGGRHSLHASTLSGGSQLVIATWAGSGGNNYGVAVDRLAQRVYWTDANGISSCAYSGAGATTVLASYNATELEVDGAAGKLFWADYGPVGVTIFSANLNGSNQQTLLSMPSGGLISGMAVNPATQTLYWVDYLSGTLSSIPYAGGTPTTLLSGSQFLSGVDYEPWSNRLYMAWKHPVSGTIAWMSPSGGPLTTVFSGSGPTQGEMWDIAAVAPAPTTLSLLACAGVLARRRRR